MFAYALRRLALTLRECRQKMRDSVTGAVTQCTSMLLALSRNVKSVSNSQSGREKHQQDDEDPHFSVIAVLLSCLVQFHLKPPLPRPLGPGGGESRVCSEIAALE